MLSLKVKKNTCSGGNFDEDFNKADHFGEKGRLLTKKCTLAITGEYFGRAGDNVVGHVEGNSASMQRVATKCSIEFEMSGRPKIGADEQSGQPSGLIMPLVGSGEESHVALIQAWSNLRYKV